MIWILVVFIILLLGGVVVVAAGHANSMAAPKADRAPLDLPSGKLSGADLRAVGFNTAIRGYRMDEVDELLARLATQLADNDKGANRGSDRN